MSLRILRILNSEISFVSKKPRKKSTKASNQESEAESSEDEEQETGSEYGNVKNQDELFFCPEEGCIKSYQRYSSFEKPLECGRHKYALENKTLYNKAMEFYEY